MVSLVIVVPMVPVAVVKVAKKVDRWVSEGHFCFELNCQEGPSTGCPKKIRLKAIFEFLSLGREFLGVRNNSKNFGNKKILGCLAKF